MRPFLLGGAAGILELLIAHIFGEPPYWRELGFMWGGYILGVVTVFIGESLREGGQ